MQQTAQVNRSQILAVTGIRTRDIQVIHRNIDVLTICAFDTRDSKYTGLIAIGIWRIGSMGEGKVVQNQAYTGAINLRHLGLIETHHLCLERQRQQESDRQRYLAQEVAGTKSVHQNSPRPRSMYSVR